MASRSQLSTVILERLGLIVIQWAQIEALTGELLERILKATPGTVHAIIPTVSNSSLISWARVLAADRFGRPEFRDRVLAALNEADELRAERNALVHGVWCGGPEPETAIVNTVRLDRPEMIVDRLLTFQSSMSLPFSSRTSPRI
jgi:hypothetical protein